jgi:hypothetical protein
MTIPAEEQTLAPPECIVCGRSMKNPPVDGFSYLSGAKPMGAVACVGKCTETAIGRWQRTGRVDSSS